MPEDRCSGAARPGRVEPFVRVPQDRVLGGVALLDRPASMLKDNLRDYRSLGLHVEARIQLRKALACFWARGDASESIERSMRPQIENRSLEDLE